MIFCNVILRFFSLFSVVIIMLVKCDGDSGWIFQDEGMIYTCNDYIGWNVNFNNGFNIKNGTHFLTVQNCRNVTVSFQTHGSHKLKSLALRNIHNLSIVPLDVKSITPFSVFIENSRIDYLPAQSFVTGDQPWESIIFNSVIMKHVETEAFFNLSISGHFLMNDVRIVNMSMHAMQLHSGEVKLHNSHFQIMDLLSVQAISHNVDISHCFIKELRLQALDIITDTFTFHNNSGFDIVMPGAFSVIAREATMTNNNFNYLQTSALEHISPLNHNDSRVYFKFHNNVVKTADAGSLHVDFLAYAYVKGVIDIRDNSFVCSCTHLGWLGVIASTSDPDLPELRMFHQELLSEKSNNTCYDIPCKLSIAVLQTLVERNSCADNITGQELCKLFDHTSIHSLASKIRSDYFIFMICISCFMATLLSK